LKFSKTTITFTAEQPPNAACLVAVVDVGRLLERAIADGTQAALIEKHLLNIAGQ
jgi:hypothetical protein